jgi:hypothetical protein
VWEGNLFTTIGNRMTTRAAEATGKPAVHFVGSAAQTLSQRAGFHFHDLF